MWIILQESAQIGAQVLVLKVPGISEDAMTHSPSGINVTTGTHPVEPPFAPGPSVQQLRLNQLMFSIMYTVHEAIYTHMVVYHKRRSIVDRMLHQTWWAVILAADAFPDTYQATELMRWS